MVTITVTLPDELAEKAKAEGLLSAAALETLLREKISFDDNNTQLPEGFDPDLVGKISPKLFGKGETLCDIVAPLGVKWEADI